MTDARAVKPIAEIELLVPGMICDGCAERVRDVLMAVSGVRVVKPNPWRKRVAVQYEPSQVKPVHLEAALGAAGFDTAEA